MRKYIATPGSEGLGSAMRNFFVSLTNDETLPLVQQVFAKYGVEELHDDQWYPVQLTMDVFRLVEDKKTNASTNLVALGMAYVDTVTFPPEVNTVLFGLTALQQTYHLNVRYAPDTEGYVVHQISDNHLQIEDHTPFPHDTVFGFIWGIARRFRPSKDSFPMVDRSVFNPDDPDSDGALYNVKW